MNNDLQAIMARRRKLAEGKQDDTAKAPAAPPGRSPPPTQKESLQKIMERRRRIADGDEKELSVEDLKREAPTHSSSFHGSGSFEHGAHSSRGDLQSIMERRRRLADGEDVSDLPVPQSPSRDARPTVGGGTGQRRLFQFLPCAHLPRPRSPMFHRAFLRLREDVAFRVILPVDRACHRALVLR